MSRVQRITNQSSNKALKDHRNEGQNDEEYINEREIAIDFQQIIPQLP